MTGPGFGISAVLKPQRFTLCLMSMFKAQQEVETYR